MNLIFSILGLLLIVTYLFIDGTPIEFMHLGLLISLISILPKKTRTQENKRKT